MSFSILEAIYTLKTYESCDFKLPGILYIYLDAQMAFVFFIYVIFLSLRITNIAVEKQSSKIK